ncbi:hypothetical protein A2160_01750 [Candidatus Beckwithbacteria bacterium RBG_13_42_9]|uniref:Uncharacterized protein n=1 Tax=Candidatus Beckwithbacteria bacterium RBG_13_42_9 TaxID=1797457 RepID=A0A1F5E876_9BACT|nr:MAG: hypothetical protein A2160_01750 [Candidatus Beckwithbacteria bacterium RBG_13_42_9]
MSLLATRDHPTKFPAAKEAIRQLAEAERVSRETKLGMPISRLGVFFLSRGTWSKLAGSRLDPATFGQMPKDKASQKDMFSRIFSLAGNWLFDNLIR